MDQHVLFSVRSDKDLGTRMRSAVIRLEIVNQLLIFSNNFFYYFDIFPN